MGGLGFWYKWNLGWMHDTTDYMKLDPVYRQYHHDKLTFGILYNYTENFVLPLSHDEVVHGKNRFSTACRATHGRNCQPARLLWLDVGIPGKKLLFMGERICPGP